MTRADWRPALIVAMTLLLAGCGRPPAAAPLGAQNGAAGASASSPMAMPMMPHADHRPRHGGIVLMNGDLHFEVVMPRTAHYQVYFSNAVRDPLPASIASDVIITVQRPGRSPESLTLQINDTGEYWEAQGQPVTEPDAMARIAYVVSGKPYWIDMPYVDPVANKK
ncbi:MAG: hypothetical protein KGN76_01960 [Acidobacteriota bacterium]|nr:hypothetical protein [Acidobacteriota bacterium]